MKYTFRPGRSPVGEAVGQALRGTVVEWGILNRRRRPIGRWPWRGSQHFGNCHRSLVDRIRSFLPHASRQGFVPHAKAVYSAQEDDEFKIGEFGRLQEHLPVKRVLAREPNVMRPGLSHPLQTILNGRWHLLPRVFAVAFPEPPGDRDVGLNPKSRVAGPVITVLPEFYFKCA